MGGEISSWPRKGKGTSAKKLFVVLLPGPQYIVCSLTWSSDVKYLSTYVGIISATIIAITRHRKVIRRSCRRVDLLQWRTSWGRWWSLGICAISSYGSCIIDENCFIRWRASESGRVFTINYGQINRATEALNHNLIRLHVPVGMEGISENWIAI